jgi:LysM repeat protein
MTYRYRKFAARFAIVFVLMLCIVSITAIVQANAGSANSGSEAGSAVHSASVPASAAKVIVEQGDSLWVIASAHAPKGTDVRSYIDSIKKLNQLKSSDLREGQVLLLP